MLPDLGEVLLRSLGRLSRHGILRRHLLVNGREGLAGERHCRSVHALGLIIDRPTQGAVVDLLECDSIVRLFLGLWDRLRERFLDQRLVGVALNVGRALLGEGSALRELEANMCRVDDVRDWLGLGLQLQLGVLRILRLRYEGAEAS